MLKIYERRIDLFCRAVVGRYMRSGFMGKIFAVVWRLRYFGACVVVAGVLCYALLWAGVYRLRGRVAAAMERRLGCEIEAGRVSVGAGLWLDFSDVLVWERGRDRAHPLLRVARVRVAPDVLRSLAGRMRVRRVELWAPELDIAPERGGTFRPEVWLRRAMPEKRAALPADFPARIEIHDGMFLIHAIPDSGREASYIYADHINGVVGRAGGGGDVGVRLAGRLWGSDATLEGVISPRRGCMMALRLRSEAFDFDRALSLAGEYAGRALHLDGVPAGTGRLSLDVGGTPAAPVFSGRVWLRHADADFTARDRALEFKNINALYEGRRIRGTAKIDFNNEEIPFVVEVDLGALDAGDMLERATGPSFAPRGTIRGTLRLRGRLTDSECCRISGHIAMKDGAFFVPMVQPGAGAAFPSSDIEAIPFDAFDADYEVSDDDVILNRIALLGRGFTMRGRAVIQAAPNIERGFRGGFAYSLDLSVSSREMSDIEGVEFARYFTGRMKGRIRLDGNLRRVGSAAGTARFELRDGYVNNPFYEPEDDEEPQSVGFDKMTADIELSDRVFTLAGRLKNGDSLILWEGSADPYGDIDLRARARIDDNLAGDLLGLRPFLPDDADDLLWDAVFESEITVTGPLDNPVTTWTRPRIVRDEE